MEAPESNFIISVNKIENVYSLSNDIFAKYLLYASVTTPLNHT